VLDPFWKLSPQIHRHVWDTEIEVTTKCYLRCTHCEHTYWKDRAYANQNLTFAEFKNFLDGLPHLKWINLTGEGSSFLNPDFMDMLRYARSKNLYIDFSHDFLQFNDDMARELIRLDIDRIYLSIDGATKETYEKIRVGSDFDRVIKNMKRFIELKREANSPLPELCFRMAFFKDNMHEIETMMDLIHSLGEARDLGDEPSVNIVGLLEFEETKGWVKEISPEVVRRTDAKAKRYGLTNYWSHPSHVESQKPPMDYCMFWAEPYIMIRGYVMPCCGIMMSNRREFLEEYALGNINNDTLEGIYHSPKYREFRRLVTNPRSPVPILCAGCRSFNSSDRVKKYGIAYYLEDM